MHQCALEKYLILVLLEDDGTDKGSVISLNCTVMHGLVGDGRQVRQRASSYKLKEMSVKTATINGFC